MNRITLFILTVLATSLCLADQQGVEQSRYQSSDKQQSKAQSLDPKEYEVWGLAMIEQSLGSYRMNPCLIMWGVANHTRDVGMIR